VTDDHDPPEPHAAAAPPGPRPRRRVAGTWGVHLGLAAVAYIPLLCTAPGMVGADTELDLYLDPSRFLSQVASMWDPDQSMGTVTHQYIGYLLPMGPYYALTHALGVPTWVAQRLWTGSLLFLAGAGVLFLLRTLAPSPVRAGSAALDMAGLGGVGAAVAALAYMLSPYVMQNEARQSVLLLPWVGLPWMIGLVARALRRGGWRHAALFALVVALVGSTNATGLLLVGAGPLLWVLWELAARRVAWRRALATTAKVVVLSALVSLWWAEGLAVEGAYGMDILRYTESVPTVALTTSAAETLRGLGYWYTYGVDNLGLYLPMAGPYMTSLWLLAVSFAVPAAAVVGAVVTRWRQRTFFVGLVALGTVLAVGAHPLADPTPLGRLVKTGMSDSTVGLALRSTNRAAPLVVLGVAVLLGSAVAAVAARWRTVGILTAAACAALVGADLPSLWTGQFVAADLEHAEAVPSYFQQAATYLDDQRGAAQTRVLTEPGIDFASYRWGSTLQPVLPALMTRPEVDRGLVPYGSPGSADLLMALDEEVQTLTVDPSALAPLLRLMSAGDLVVDSDYQYERYATPRPQALWQLLDPAPAGLKAPVGFGDRRVTQAEPEHYPLVDETALGLPHDAASPPPLAVLAVPGARPIVRTEGARAPLLVDGSGQGLVAAAGTGLLDGQATVLYSPSLASDPAALRGELARGAALVVTDSNRLQAEQFGTVRENYGATEQPGAGPPTTDTRDAPLPLFPASDGTDTETVALLAGVQGVQASGYGNPITYTPESRPDQALDGSLRTAWTVGAFDNPVGQFLRVTLTHPVSTGSLNLVQPLFGTNDRWITRVTLRFDGGRPVTLSLGPSSRTAGGQTVTFPTRSFRTLRITIDATDPPGPSSAGTSGVGFAEVRIPGISAKEIVRMPEDLLRAAGTSSLSHRLTLVMSRQRSQAVPPRTDPEVDLDRQFTLPTARTFALSGTAEVSALAPDDVIDDLLGTTVPGVLAAYSSGRLPGDIGDRASATLDGNPATVWSPGLGTQSGTWLDYRLPRPVTFDHLALDVVTDGRHSVPTEVTVSAGAGQRVVQLPPLADSTTPWATQTVPLSFPALTGSNVRITFDAVRPVTDVDYYANRPIDLPLGIAEVDVPGMTTRGPGSPGQVPPVCRSDLLAVDGVPVPVTVTGTSTAAESLGALQVRGCGAAAAGITLGPGVHELQSAPGFPGAADVQIDDLVLDSAPGGGPMAPAPSGRVPPATSGPAPAMTVLHATATSARVEVRDPTGPFWMVLGESTNAGWHATADGDDLGAPQLVDGYANGWLVTPAHPGRTMIITLDWTPQRTVDEALVVSGAAVVVCLVVGCSPRRRLRLRRPRPLRRGVRAEAPPDLVADDTGPALAGTGPPVGVGAGAGRDETGALAFGDPAPVSPPPPSDGEGPVLASPLSSAGQRPHWSAVVVSALAVGALVAAAVSPAAGVALGAATVPALWWRRGRLVLSATAVAAVVALDVVVTRGQALWRWPAQFNWPTHFESAGTLAWIAVAALAADAVVAEVRQRRRGRHLRRR